LLATPASAGTGIIVVIPCFNEPDIIKTLDSIDQCEPPPCGVEIIIVINHSVSAKKSVKSFNIKTYKEVSEWIATKRRFDYHIIQAFDLPEKKSGVGIARKIGMDEAVRRFESISSPKGIIVCFDADCECSPNYLCEIYQAFTDQKTKTGLAYFEHCINSPDEFLNEAITDYELHLRYYVQALRLAQFPFAYHTVGSCISVTSDTYQKQGGMNSRKAGEDFYFLQRVFPLGGVKNLTKAVVTPSARPSDRVPFGTGKAVRDILQSNNHDFLTYNPKSFIDFRRFNQHMGQLWNSDSIDDFMHNQPVSVHQYLSRINFEKTIQKLKNNTTSQEVFLQSVYNWMSGFKALKFVHFARDRFYPNIKLIEAVNWILSEKLKTTTASKKEALLMMRKLDRSDQ
jgi:glycosyltransferase involved in cell wall biosynthesis